MVVITVLSANRRIGIAVPEGEPALQWRATLGPKCYGTLYAIKSMQVDVKNNCGSDSGATSVASSLASVKFKTLARHAIKSIKNDTTIAFTEARQTTEFSSWDSADLRCLLADQGIEVRGGDSAPRESLVRICEALFADGRPSGLSPPMLSNEVLKAEEAARIIQRTYFATACRRDEIESDSEEDGRGEPADNEDDDDDELDIEWRRPSYRYAKRLDISSRPNRDSKSLDWRRITLGRHCTMTGCGEQLDLWDEGCTSELSQFGSGITNYFKFLKWCCWVMVVLSILHLPILIINVMGGSLQYEANNAASTTFGNLGAANEVFTVRLPFCDVGDFVSEDGCLISKDRLAIGFAWLDAASTIFVICAILGATNVDGIGHCK